MKNCCSNLPSQGTQDILGLTHKTKGARCPRFTHSGVPQLIGVVPPRLNFNAVLDLQLSITMLPTDRIDYQVCASIRRLLFSNVQVQACPLVFCFFNRVIVLGCPFVSHLWYQDKGNVGGYKSIGNTILALLDALDFLSLAPFDSIIDSHNLLARNGEQSCSQSSGCDTKTNTQGKGYGECSWRGHVVGQ
jgi:hypothetical protein